jgi:uncharacterized protein YjbI with pentapeptide repeats
VSQGPESGRDHGELAATAADEVLLWPARSPIVPSAGTIAVQMAPRIAEFADPPTMTGRLKRRARSRLIPRAVRYHDAQGQLGQLIDPASVVDIDDTDLVAQQREILVLVWKRQGVWRGAVQQSGRTDVVPPGSLERVILGAQSTIFASVPIALAGAAHRGALQWANIRLKVREYTSITEEELLVLIDAGALRDRLDLSQCLIENVNLSAVAIAQRWKASPDARSGLSPYWKSPTTGGLSLDHACLRGTMFSQCELQGADLEGADLNGARLDQTNLQDAEMLHADLTDAQLTDCNLQRAQLLRASFAGAQVFRSRFDDAMLFGTNWRGAKVFESRFDNACLVRAHLEEADYYGLEPGSLSGVSWSNAFLDRTRLRADQLGWNIGEETVAHTGARVVRQRGSAASDVTRILPERRADAYRDARETYLLLKNNFNSIGRYRDASWAYQKERQMEREQLFRTMSRRDPRTWPNARRWLLNWMECAITGYGERPWRTLWSAAGTMLLFAALYDGFNLIGPSNGSTGVSLSNVSYWDALLYSGSAFFTAGYGGMRPTSPLADGITIVESGLGITLVALLLYTLGNRISYS